MKSARLRPPLAAALASTSAHKCTGAGACLERGSRRQKSGGRGGPGRGLAPAWGDRRRSGDGPRTRPRSRGKGAGSCGLLQKGISKKRFNVYEVFLSGSGISQNNHGDMKIYMDVCCLCRPFDDRTQDRIRIESEAVLTILGRCNVDWILVGSDAVDFEISAVMDQKKRTDAFVLASLAKEKIKTDERIIKRASELEKLGFQTMDSAHISYAERAADIMLTADEGILRKAKTKRNQIYVEIENPVRWLINVFQD